MELIIQQIVNGLALGGTYALIAIGLANIFNILELINFAHGELLTITGYTMFFLLAFGFPFGLVVILAIAASALAAVAMERIGFRPLRGATGSTLLLTSFAISTIIQILFQNFVDPRGKPVPIPESLNQMVVVAGFEVGLKQLLAVVTSIVMLGVMSLFLKKTRLGISIRAASQDFGTTRLMGINANAVISTVFATSGLMAGIAGVLWVAQRTTVDPFMGFIPVLKAFIACIVGGLGSLAGPVVAAYMLGFLEIMVQAFLPGEIQIYREGVVWLVVIAVLLWRPNGIFAAPNEAVRA